MDAATGWTVIDTNVFVIDLRYKRDRHFATNRAFLDRIARAGSGVTTIFNLLEVCGILSFNLNAQQLRELFVYFPQQYQVRVLPAHEFEVPLPALSPEDLFVFLVQRASFGDGLIMAAITRHIPDAVRFVSWDAKHFRDRLPIPVLTPQQFLRTR